MVNNNMLCLNNNSCINLFRFTIIIILLCITNIIVKWFVYYYRCCNCIPTLGNKFLVSYKLKLYINC